MSAVIFAYARVRRAALPYFHAIAALIFIFVAKNAHAEFVGPAYFTPPCPPLTTWTADAEPLHLAWNPFGNSGSTGSVDATYQLGLSYCAGNLKFEFESCGYSVYNLAVISGDGFTPRLSAEGYPVGPESSFSPMGSSVDVDLSCFSFSSGESFYLGYRFNYENLEGEVEPTGYFGFVELSLMDHEGVATLSVHRWATSAYGQEIPFTPVPEPAHLALGFGACVVGAALWRRRRGMPRA